MSDPKKNKPLVSPGKDSPPGFSFRPWPLVGNAHITEFLEKSIANGKVAGTYVFHGPDNLGKATLARYFAQNLLCHQRLAGGGVLPCGSCPSCRRFGLKPKEGAAAVHADLHVINRDKEKKNIPVEDVRGFIRDLGLSPFLGRFKVGIVRHADSLSTEAANALLKTLEEPREKVVIILVAQDADSLPSTILSRSQALGLSLVGADVIYDYLLDRLGLTRSLAKNYARLCLGRPALAAKFHENKEFREGYLAALKMFLGFWAQDINGRFSAIENLFGKRVSGQEAVRTVRRTLEVWQGVVRDWLLLHYGFNNLTQHHEIEPAVGKMKDRFSPPVLLRLAGEMRRAAEFLDANVSPKMALEYVAVNL